MRNLADGSSGGLPWPVGEVTLVYRAVNSDARRTEQLSSTRNGVLRPTFR